MKLVVSMIEASRHAPNIYAQNGFSKFNKIKNVEQKCPQLLVYHPS